MKIETVKRGKKANAEAALKQYGALCYRRRDKDIQFLLITTRGSGQWLIPKGWPIPKLGPHGTAAREAFEEAGVQGKTGKKKIGEIDHLPSPGRGTRPRSITVFPLEVRTSTKKYPEAGQRRRKWFSRKKAAKLVKNPQLAKLIREFEPKVKRKA